MNIKHQSIFTGDNLPILRGINSNCIDLIYLDPPFNSNHNYAAAIDSAAAGAEFKDTWSIRDIEIAGLDAIRAKHGGIFAFIQTAFRESDKSYLTYLAIRLLEMHRILKPTGSIYLHCDPTMSHYLKVLMDGIFGRAQFRNEIVWCYHGPGSPKMRQFNRKTDHILWYAKGDKWTFNRDAVRIPYADGAPHAGGYGINAQTAEEYGAHGKVPENWWPIRIAARSKTEYTGYPTQKPLALLERIVNAGSNEGDMVLDPFCGCATTCVAAERLARQWVGIDISETPARLIKLRLQKEANGLIYRGAHLYDAPRRTDLGNPPKYNSPENKRKLYGEQHGNCAICNTHFEHRHLEVDHILPKNHGGTAHIENLQLLCGSCNRIKGDRSEQYVREKLRMW